MPEVINNILWLPSCYFQAWDWYCKSTHSSSVDVFDVASCWLTFVLNELYITSKASRVAALLWSLEGSILSTEIHISKESVFKLHSYDICGENTYEICSPRQIINQTRPCTLSLSSNLQQYTQPLGTFNKIKLLFHWRCTICWKNSQNHFSDLDCFCLAAKCGSFHSHQLHN